MTAISYSRLTFLFVTLPSIQSHSWIDFLTCVLSNGQKGVPRNYAGHKDKYMSLRVDNHDMSFDFASSFDQWNKLYSRRLRGEADTQHELGQQLSCPAGSKVTFTYTPNGHVTKDKCIVPDESCQYGEKNHPTSNYQIHWNKDGDQLDQYDQLTEDNTVPGSTAPFDDGTCGEPDNATQIETHHYSHPMEW